jgi:hypothetical protein
MDAVGNKAAYGVLLLFFYYFILFGKLYIILPNSVTKLPLPRIKT